MTVPPPWWGDGPAPKCVRENCRARQHPWAHGYCTEHAYAAGVFEPRVSPDRAREHLLSLDGTNSAIARAAGVAEETIIGVLSGRYEMISARTNRRILATTQDAVRPDRREVWPLIRRVRALRAAGWTNVEIAAHCGFSGVETISRVCRGDMTYVLSATDDRIRAGYVSAPKQVRRRPHWSAVRAGWAAPYQWEDIDWPEDPAAGDRADEKPLVDHEFCG